MKLWLAAAFAVVAAGVVAVFLVLNSLPTTIEATASLNEGTATQLSFTNEAGTRILVSIPAGAYSELATVIIRSAPIGGDEGIGRIDDRWGITDKFELLLMDMNGKEVSQPTFQRQVIITVDYTDRHLGLVANNSELLALARLNESKGGDATWELIHTSVSTEAETLEALVGHFTVFGVAAISDSERLPQPVTPTPPGVAPTAAPTTATIPSATADGPTPTPMGPSPATVTPIVTPTQPSTGSPTLAPTSTATQAAGPLTVSFTSGRWVGNGWGKHLIVTAGRSVTVYVTLESAHATAGDLLVEVRKDNAFSLDSTVAVCVDSQRLEPGKQEVAACTFTPTDVTDGSTRHYYFRVYWDNSPIHPGEEPGTRETLKVVKPLTEHTLLPVPPLPAADPSPVLLPTAR
jgi:hypothetical protein